MYLLRFIILYSIGGKCKPPIFLHKMTVKTVVLHYVTPEAKSVSFLCLKV